MCISHTRLESLFSKKQTPHVHAHHSHHAFAYVARHDHTHTHKHPKVYKCIHCGRKGHLAKFCFDKMHHVNFANKNVLKLVKEPKHSAYYNVPYKTNPQGPKKIWVPKPPPLGEGSHKT